MADHIVLNPTAFMGDHNPANPVSGSGGHRTTENFESANPFTPTDGPPPQASLMNMPPIPITFPSTDPAANAG